MAVVRSAAPGKPVTPVGYLPPCRNVTVTAPAGGDDGGGVGAALRARSVGPLGSMAPIGVDGLHDAALELLDRPDRFIPNEPILGDPRQGRRTMRIEQLLNGEDITMIGIGNPLRRPVD